MNSQGDIQQFKTDEEAKAAGYDIPLSREEAEQLESVPDDERELELMWVRFWQNQRATRKPSEKLPMRHAFLTGCRVMIAKLNED